MPGEWGDPRLALDETLASREGGGGAGDPEAVLVSTRYEVRGEVARGGMGTVLRAFDRRLRREVALKVMNARADITSDRLRFLDEARATAQLEHPSIVPVQDVGALEDGRPFFAMKLVRGRTLDEVLSRVRAGQHDAHGSLSSLVQAFLRVCEAVAFAHIRQVIHRDLKPENIMLGEFGEVYVMDWGLFKISETPRPPRPRREPIVAFHRSESVDGLRGTLAYMSPEQARGEALGAQADVYGLGAVLYEILCGVPPILIAPGDTLDIVLERLSEGERVPPGRRRALLAEAQRLPWEVPDALEGICVSALAADPACRPAGAARLVEAITAYLDGSLEREIRGRAAGRARARGAEAELVLETVRGELASLSGWREGLLERVPPWDQGAAKRELREAVLAGETLLAQEAACFAEATRAFEEALAHEPGDDEVRRRLGALYLSRHEQARAAHDEPGRLYFEGLVRQRNPSGSLAALLDGRGALRAGAGRGRALGLYRYLERDFCLVAEGPIATGRGGLDVTDLEAGTYLVTAGELRLPVCVASGARAELTVPDARAPDGFVVVAGGPFTCGGDDMAPGSMARAVVNVPTFLLHRFATRNREYLAWLRGLSPERRRRHAPRRAPDGGWFWDPADPVLPEGDPLWHPDAPVVGVSYQDAVAYTADHGWRLPTELEWEKAARGVDGRIFPWGNRFDATFCRMRDSRPGAPTPEPVGAYPVDESPYGVRDLAGGSRDFTSSTLGGDLRVVRGGAWNVTALFCRLGFRYGYLPDEVFLNVGIRPAKDV